QYREGAVPAAIVPAAITKYVTENYPDAYIRSIERDRHAYEVNLSNRWEIKFDLNFNVIDLDN
ncbi:MAG: PepSY-like domain-containing protein, partial [Tidjanibacter sp.]|nr:PepSY-like domain-containing protein [Tidjanibacter sp.]